MWCIHFCTRNARVRILVLLIKRGENNLSLENVSQTFFLFCPYNFSFITVLSFLIFFYCLFYPQNLIKLLLYLKVIAHATRTISGLVKIKSDHDLVLHLPLIFSQNTCINKKVIFNNILIFVTNKCAIVTIVKNNIYIAYICVEGSFKKL